MVNPQRQSRHERHNQPKWFSFLQSQGTLSVIAMTMLLAPLAPAPATSVRWHGAQTLVVEVGAVILLVLLLRRLWSAHTWSRITIPSPFVFLCASLIWDLFSWVRSGGSPSATQSLLLLASSVIFITMIVYYGQTEQDLLLLTDALMIAAFLVAFSGVTLYGIDRTPLIVGVLHDHMLFGAFIMLLIPIALAISMAPVTPIRRLFAQVTLVTCIAAVLMAQTRSSWIGCTAALLTFGGLLLYVGSVAPQKNYHTDKWQQLARGGMIPALAVISVGCFIWLSPERDTLYARARTLTTTVAQGKDASTEWRFTAWTGAEKMIGQYPLVGWGLGSYPQNQHRFTHMGQSAELIARRGPSILDETHNSYLQIWVETGLVGLILWGGFLLSFFIVAARSLRRLAAGGLEQRILIGGLSAAVGQALDAFANPAWQFGHITLPYWIIIGLVISIVQRQRSVSAFATTPNRATTKLGWFAQSVQLVMMLFVMLALLRLILQTAFALPAPYL